MALIPNKNGNNGKKSMASMYWMYILIIACLFGLYYFQDNSQTKNVDWSEFEAAAEAGDISRIEVVPESGIAVGVLTKEGAKRQKMAQGKEGQDVEKRIKTTIPSSNKIQDKIDTWNEELKKADKPEISVKYEKGSDLMKIFWYFGPIVLFVILMVWMSRRMSGGAGGGGGIFSVGKSKARIFDKDNRTDVTFKDVAGLAEAKVEIEEIVEFLKNPQRYTELGAKIPRGHFSLALRAPARHCSQRLWREKPAYPSSPFPVLTSLRCL